MSDNETRPRPPGEQRTIERRSLTDVAIVVTPAVLAAQPIIGALADKYIGPKPSDSSPPPQEPKPPAEPAE